MISNKFYTLIKYISNRKYVKDFMTGKLFMNYLGYFWNRRGNSEGQTDMYEGTILTSNSKQFCINDDEFNAHRVRDHIFKAEGYKYCNIMCFYRVDFMFSPWKDHDIEWDSSKGMDKFGKFIVIIKDANEFVRRVDNAVRREKFKFVAGSVDYHEIVKDGVPTPEGPQLHLQSEPPFEFKTLPQGEKFDSFDKTRIYEYQKEWRISLYRGVREEKPYTLDVGNLCDIATWKHTYELEEQINYLLKSGKIKPLNDYGYKGNSDRASLRELFYELGDYKATLCTVLG